MSDNSCFTAHCGESLFSLVNEELAALNKNILNDPNNPGKDKLYPQYDSWLAGYFAESFSVLFLPSAAT